MRLKDKVVIVTGAGSGFGAGIAKRFADEGARVIVNDVNPTGQKVAQDIGGTFVQADVTKSDDWAKLVRSAGPQLDIVVNNAGWTHRNKAYLEAIANVRLHPTAYIVESTEYNTILNPVLEQIWKGEQQARSAIPPLIPQLNEVLARG